MAETTLAQPRTTDGRSAWQKYVGDNQDLAGTDYEIDKNLPKTSVKSLILETSNGVYAIRSQEYEPGTKLKILDKNKKIIKLENGTTYECAQVSIQGDEGYLPIRIIKKPTSATGRIKTGAMAQKQVPLAVSKIADELDLGMVSLVSEAKIGSQAGDVVLDVGGKKIQVEVKSGASGGKEITLYDKTYQRGKKFADIDSYAQAIFSTRSTFEEVIDQFRSGSRVPKKMPTDYDPKTIGFIGDEGVKNASGKIPSDFQITDSKVLNSLRNKLLEKFQKGGDTYFAFVAGSEVKMFFVGKNTSDNVLKRPEFPRLKTFKLDTYGSAPSKRLRVGIKVTLF